VPPFGSLFNIQTYVDESLFKQGEMINFNAGLRTKSILMKGEDFKNIENPTIINISENLI
jgi:Ala-tRNA(Pro) deacylase